MSQVLVFAIEYGRYLGVPLTESLHKVLDSDSFRPAVFFRMETIAITALSLHSVVFNAYLFSEHRDPVWDVLDKSHLHAVGAVSDGG